MGTREASSRLFLTRVGSRLLRSATLSSSAKSAVARALGTSWPIPLRSLEEVERKLEEAAALPTDGERVEFLSNHYFDRENGFDRPAGPFSDDYREWAHELWSRLSRRREQYDPAAHELSGYQEEVDMRSPPPYNIGSGHLLGESSSAGASFFAHSI